MKHTKFCFFFLCNELLLISHYTYCRLNGAAGRGTTSKNDVYDDDEDGDNETNHFFCIYFLFNSKQNINFHSLNSPFWQIINSFLTERTIFGEFSKTESKEIVEFFSFSDQTLNFLTVVHFLLDY